MNISFITAQPDVPYFHWQCKLYTYNFIKLGIRPEQIHIVFSIFKDKQPSEGALELKKTGVNVHFFVDERKDKSYIPSVKPYLVSKWMEQNPELGKLFFLHDADIIFRKLPNFDSLLVDDINYLSDTIGYIGYDYIVYACKNYERKHQQLKQGQLLEEMAKVIDLPVELIKENQKNSGGGQYLIKNTTHDLWWEIYEDCTPLYNKMKEFHKIYPIDSGAIQFWTAEMWSTLWHIWKAGQKTKISQELNFSWATDNVKIYENKNILHMAGVTNSLKDKMFYKGEYINVNPIEKLRINSNHFDYVDKNNASWKYIELMQELIISQNFGQ
jgi:hypothetical protein